MESAGRDQCLPAKARPAPTAAWSNKPPELRLDSVSKRARQLTKSFRSCPCATPRGTGTVHTRTVPVERSFLCRQGPHTLTSAYCLSLGTSSIWVLHRKSFHSFDFPAARESPNRLRGSRRRRKVPQRRVEGSLPQLRDSHESRHQESVPHLAGWNGRGAAPRRPGLLLTYLPGTTLRRWSVTTEKYVAPCRFFLSWGLMQGIHSPPLETWSEMQGLRFRV